MIMCRLVHQETTYPCANYTFPCSFLLQVKEILMIIYAVRLRMWHIYIVEFKICIRQIKSTKCNTIQELFDILTHHFVLSVI